MRKIRKRLIFPFILAFFALCLMGISIVTDYNIAKLKAKDIEVFEENLKYEDSNTDSNFDFDVAELKVIAMLYVPDLKLSLPIYKTRYDDEELSEQKQKKAENNGAALWYRMDDYNKGKGSKALLSSHNGLSTQDLFTNLIKLNLKSNFYIKDLSGDIFQYEVSEIEKATPDVTTVFRDVYVNKDGHDYVIRKNHYERNDTLNEMIDFKDYNGVDTNFSEIEKIDSFTSDERLDPLYLDPNEELMVLQTCIPIFVNSHRLLVTGKRVPYDGSDLKTYDTLKRNKIILIIWIIALIVLFIKIIVNVLNNRKYKKILKLKKEGM